MSACFNTGTKVTPRGTGSKPLPNHGPSKGAEASHTAQAAVVAGRGLLVEDGAQGEEEREYARFGQLPLLGLGQ
eukprot:6417704-Lingulodinium_polyedra.AAC.1